MKPLIRGSIARRLFLFNILIVFMPVAGFFSLSLYEDRLLSDLENSMVQQARIVSAWLGEGPLSKERAKSILSSLKQKQTARIRIVDAEGNLIADSASVQDAASAVKTLSSSSRAEYADTALEPLKMKAETTVLYRALSFPIRIARKYLIEPAPPLESADFYSGKGKLEGAEVRKALSGAYGAITRISSGGQNSVTLYSAVPVMEGENAAGAVLVSQSTYKILSSLYDFRLETGKIFLFSLLAAALVSLFLALTISRPLTRLKREAEEVIGGDRTIPHSFHLTGRNDEIDRLSASLSSLVGDLRRQIALSEHFASDAAHEMRNRIAGIRNAAELIAGGTTTEADASVALILENTSRMNTVISALRDLSKIEADTTSAQTEDASSVVTGVAQAMQRGFPGLVFMVSVPSPGALPPLPPLPLSGDHLEIITANLLENAASFSPEGGTVFVTLEQKEDAVCLTVRDQGPGIPEEHRMRVFERFFSWRPENGEAHTGIGLSIVEAVMRKAGGSVSCKEGTAGGAEFTLLFPYLNR